MIGLAVALLLQGTDYRPSMSPLSYAFGKSALGGAVYLVGRELGLPKRPAAAIAIGGPWLIGKLIAWRQQHRIPLGDALGDLAWAGLIVVPVATHSLRWTVVTVSIAVATCPHSSPRICR